MAYNPGISYRGEMLGQAIGQAGQSLAQAYGQGLQLKELNKQRKQLKKSLEIQAELLGGDKDEIATMGLGELQGFVEGTRAQRQFEYEGLRLQELKDALEEDKQGKFAMSQMQSYVTGGIDPMTALNQALADVPDINPRTALALREFATSGMKMDLEMQQAENRSRALDLQAAGQEISQGTLDVQRDQSKLARDKFEKSKEAPTTRTFKTEGGREYDQVGDRIFPVENEEEVTTPGQLKQPQISQVLTELQKLKDSGESHATVSKDGVVRGSRFFTNDDPIDELMQRYRLMSDPEKIKRDAKAAIDGGADPEAVKKAMKERYGIDL
jgi:hypothetical protein